jgi:16S rRNA (guanine(527)-N(7))-methyltransferase RsmG
VFHVKHAEAATPLGETSHVPLDNEAAAKLEAFQDLLLRWNSRINLIAKATPEVVRHRHIEDCLQIVPLISTGRGPLADLGSGAGLPGLILAIITGGETHLVEADRRKAAFLVEAVARLELRTVHVHPVRIEDVRLPPIATLTARALAPLNQLLPHALRLLAPNGCAIFHKGRSAEQELAEARRDWHFELERFPSRTDPDATIFRLSDMRHVQPQV